MSILGQDDFGASVRPEHCSYFHNFTKHHFMVWLRTGLEKHLQGIGPEAFPGALAELARYDYPAEGLEAAYDKLTPDLKSNFRLAVADLINSWELTEENSELLVDLLHLSVLIHAREVLWGLAAWLRLGYFQKVSEVVAARLFNQIFLTATRLATPTRETVDCIRGLVAQPQFRTSWAGMALETLWLCDSGNITSHLQRLRPHLRNLMAGAPQRPNIWAKRMLDAVGLYQLLQTLPSLKYYDLNGDDTWLVDGLLAGEQRSLECHVEEDGSLSFCQVGMPDSKETLSVELWSDMRAYLRENDLTSMAAEDEVGKVNQQHINKMEQAGASPQNAIITKHWLYKGATLVQ